MSKLKALFGGRGDDEGAAAAEPVADADVQEVAPEPVAEAAPAPIRQSFSSVDEYAATLPAPDYVDPAGKASASAA